MMRIDELPLPAAARVHGDPARTIDGVSHDSRTTGARDLYAALPGSNVHGATFAPGLIAQGVSAVLTDAAGVELLRASGADLENVTIIEVEHPRAQLGDIAAAVYDTAQGLPQLLGITGTNGKTTTTYMIDALLRALGETTGVIGTIATLIAGQRQDSVRTTPEAPELHGLLARMRQAGVTWCAMEVSSHALAQHRVDGAHFDVAGFTNLSQDHLDFHPTMEDYFEAKAQLFTPQFSQRGVIVLADDWARKLARTSPIPVVTISRHALDAPDYLITDDTGDRFTITGGPGAGLQTPLRASSPLPGDFNVMNAALAIVMLLQAGFAPAALAEVVDGFEVTVPGRMEVVSDSAPRAIVDYSHTPDALINVLRGLSGSPLVAVFGAGGDRDHSKRPLMGRAGAQYADTVIVTDDNPRSEDPAQIRAEVLAGVRAAIADGTARVAEADVREIASRAQAIATAVDLAGENGTVLVAGKGHETGQDVAGTVHPFDDRQQTREAVAGRGSAGAGRVQN